MAKKTTEIRVEPVGKGFIVHHSHDNMGKGPYQEPTKHLFAGAGAHTKMMEHLHNATKPKGVKTMRSAMEDAYNKLKKQPDETELNPDNETEPMDETPELKSEE